MANTNHEGREEVDRTVLPASGVQPESVSDNIVTDSNTEDVVWLRERIIDTPNMTYAELAMIRKQSAAVMSIQRVHESYPLKIKILRTGAYIKFSTGGLISGVLGSHRDGVLNIENFVATRQNSPNERPEYLFCCRVFIEQDDVVWFLSYIPNAESGARVQFQPFRKDAVTSDTIDGRCFIKRKYGNYTAFGSFFKDDLYMLYDRRKRKLILKRVKSLTRLPKDFLFSEIPYRPETERHSFAPARRISSLLKRIPCVSPYTATYN